MICASTIIVTPHANLFTNIDLGEGSRMFQSGGGERSVVTGVLGKTLLLGHPRSSPTTVLAQGLGTGHDELRWAAFARGCRH
ncbi:MAG: hypothetical protein R3C56_36075 [Pirellulaceae bacterium]